MELEKKRITLIGANPQGGLAERLHRNRKAPELLAIIYDEL